MELRNWSVTSNNTGYMANELLKFYLQGDVYGNDRFEDGDFVITSRIVEIEDHGDYKIGITYSGSKYILKRETVDSNYEKQYPNAFDRLSIRKYN